MTGIVAQRPKFIDGMLLSAEDLTLEQSYLDRRVQQLRTPFGSGVVEGMHVTLKEKEQTVTISCGWAVDARGREILLVQEAEGRAVTGVLCVRWQEPDERTSSDAGPSRVPSNDSAAVRLIARAQACVFGFASDLEQALLDSWVPIADVNVDAKRVTRIARLTGISRTSWEHGKRTTVLPQDLWIEFTAPVKSFPQEALDIRLRSRAIETLVGVGNPVPNGNGTHFSFAVKPQPFGGGDAIVFIRLACDFLLDLKGDAVSGAHLGGTLVQRGSGNGVPGGVFESWFSIDGQTR